jgi:hypothetical protein
MSHFLYDTHYQVDKPFALLDLTLATASPNQTTPDQVLTRRFEERAASRHVRYAGPESSWLLKQWDVNEDAFRYWIGNCHQTSLLSRQNAYDYWLMNFVWSETFKKESETWGALTPGAERLSKLLLFRWAWVHDGPMLAAVLWHLVDQGPQTKRAIVDAKTKLAERAISAVLSALRDTTPDVRLRTNYRRQIQEIEKKGFKYNTRRHKLYIHLALLLESGVIVETGDGLRVPDQLHGVLQQYRTLSESARHALLEGPLGAGAILFLDIVANAFDISAPNVTDLSEQGWRSIENRIRPFWATILRWDRKFLGIDALAEFFLVENLASEKELWPVDSWKRFLLERSRHHPDELTVHLGRFGEVKYLRLAS